MSKAPNAEALKIYETKIGSYLGKKPRISFESSRLKGTCFLPGSKIKLVCSNNKATIILDEEGKISVTSRKGEPVIDLKADELAIVFSGFEILKAVVGKKEIELSPMKEAIEQKRARDKAKPKRVYKVLDVFGSIGTLAKSMYDTGGFQIAGVIDRNEKALDTYRRNFPHAVIWAGDVANVEWGRFKACDVMVMTPSCRPFTELSKTAKKKKEMAEEGDNTVHAIVGIHTVRPAAVLLEEVLGYRKSYSYAILKSALLKMGYFIEETILDAGDFGALSFRRRFSMVASIKPGFRFGNPQPTLPMTVEDILEIPFKEREWSVDVERFKKYGDTQIAKGNNFRMQRVAGSDSRVRHPTTRYYGRQSEAFLVNPEDPEQLCRFTPRELARIAQLPDDFKLPQNKNAAAAGIGDGVVYGKFFHVGKQLHAHLSKI